MAALAPATGREGRFRSNDVTTNAEDEPRALGVGARMAGRSWNRRSAIIAATGATTAAALTGRAGAQPPGPPRLTANGRLYELHSGRYRVVVAGVAATLLSWQVDRGRYAFEGEELTVPVNEPDRGTALHGLMNFVEWDPVRSRRNSIALRYQLPPHCGYPFSMSFHIEYTVDENGVSSTLVTENTGNTNAPSARRTTPTSQHPPTRSIRSI